jgi:8-oxo-dGTP pyrophosphatase MutT (NUDIX family)
MVYDQQAMARLPRDVSVHLFRRTGDGPRFLMLRRCPARGGFWQGVTGAPLPGETDAEAAAREVREETGIDVARSLVPLGVTYCYLLQPEFAAHWEHLYGPGVETVSVVTFGAECPEGDPILDPQEHDAFAWCSYQQADALLDWPVEHDALVGRREALGVLRDHIAK